MGDEAPVQAPAPAETRAGVACIKQEYVLPQEKRAERVQVPETPETEPKKEDWEPATKKSKREERRQRGQNKARGVPWRVDQTKQICVTRIDIPEGEPWPECSRNKCSAVHDVQKYLSLKPADLGQGCFLYRTYGRCPRGLSCRFGSEHITFEGYNRVNADLYNPDRKPSSFNSLDKDLQVDLRKFKYDFKKSEEACNKLKKICEDDSHEASSKNDDAEKASGPVLDEDLFPLKQEEKKEISWKDKLYLSPLTTLGNLPFRRICKRYGADVTCGEMAVATSILQAQPQEWALVRRHESEDLFGVQICGSNPFVMTKCAQVLQEQTDVNFIDIGPAGLQDTCSHNKIKDPATPSPFIFTAWGSEIQMLWLELIFASWLGLFVTLSLGRIK